MFRWRKHREANLERELLAHLDLETQEQRESGLPPEDAGWAAHRALGNVTYIQEEVRNMWEFTWLDVLFQDLRYGLRQFGRTPTFTVVVILTLALGIGANTAIFSAMNAILLRDLPVSNPGQLVYLKSATQPKEAMRSGDSDATLPEPIFEALRAQRQVFSDLVALVPLGFSRIPVRYGAVPEEAQVDMVSGNFFSGLGVHAARGRTFLPEEETGHAGVAVLSYTWWERRFASDPSVLGQTLYVKGVPMIIIGITAPGFAGVEHSRPTDIWIPLQIAKGLKPWGLAADTPFSLYGTPNWWCLKTIGRLAPGVTVQEALARLNPIFQRTAYAEGDLHPSEQPVELQLTRARGLEGADAIYRQPLVVLMSMVGLVLVIACANVALLLVARNAARNHEFGLRLALGGGRGRLLRQLLTESLLLVTCGGGLAWLFALAATRALAAGWALDYDLTPDRTVLLFMTAVCLGSALVFGLAPLRGVLRVPIGLALKCSPVNAGQDRTGRRVSQLVVSLQLSLCLVLLVGAGLLMRTLRNLETSPLGVRATGLLVFGIDPRGLVGSEGSTRRLYADLLTRLRKLPGIESATLMDNRLGSGWSNHGNLELDGHLPGGDASVRWTATGPGYFHVLGIPLLEGRELADSDSEFTPRVVLVNHAFVSRFLPNQEPLGHTVAMWNHVQPSAIIGVVMDSRFTSVSDKIVPTAYFPYTQSPSRLFSIMQFELRTYGNPYIRLPDVRRAVAEFSPDLAVLQPITQQEQFEKSFSQARLFGRVAVFFGILAVLLVGTGIYGTVGYAVSLRTAEVGLRMALGAQRWQVLWMVLRGSLAVCFASVALGLPAAIGTARYLGSMLYGVQVGDSLTFAGAVMGILLVALTASFIPARRAALVDPIVALHHD